MRVQSRSELTFLSLSPSQVPLQNLSGLLRALGKLQEAEPLHWRALELTEAILGLEHPDTLAGEEWQVRADVLGSRLLHRIAPRCAKSAALWCTGAPYY